MISHVRCILAGTSTLQVSAELLAEDAVLRSRLASPVLEAAGAGLVIPLVSGTVVCFPFPRDVLIAEVSNDVAQRAAWGEWRRASEEWQGSVMLTSINIPTTPLSARDIATDMLGLATRLMRLLPVDGMFWEGSKLLLRAEAVLVAHSRSPLPAEALIRVNVRQSGAGELSTHGLQMFGLPELRDETGDDASVVYQRLLDMGAYLLQAGPVIRDGDTFGTDGRHRFQVCYAADAEGRPVLVLNRHASAAA